MRRHNPNDSAISVACSENKLSTTNSTNPTTPTTNSPLAPVSVPYCDLSPEAQAAQDIENNSAVQQAQESIDIDLSFDEQSDAGYGTDSLEGSATTSLASSVRDFTFENGRRYHRFREGQYNFPNDDSEQEREDMKHAMMVNLCQTLHFAPIEPNSQNILDMGTGTGIWAIESGCAARDSMAEMLILESSGRSISKCERLGCRPESVSKFDRV